MSGIDQCDRAERHARIEQMIEEYREAKRRRLLQRAITLWCRTEAHQELVNLEAGPQRVH